MLGYRDSGMADTPPNEHPDSFHQADLDEATGRLVADDPPHPAAGRSSPTATTSAATRTPTTCKVHDISVLAFDRAGDPDWYPELGEPFQPSKLYYSAWSRARMLADPRGAARAATASRRSTRSGSSAPTRTTASRRGSTSASSSGPARQSLRAHATQVDPTEGWWFGLDDDELVEVVPVGGLDPRPLARRPDPRRTTRATTCSPACADQRRSEPSMTTRPVPGRRRQEGRARRGARRRRRSSSPCRSTSCRPTASTRPSRTCRAS